MNQITLPMTIPELRVDGAPILVMLPNGKTVSGVYLGFGSQATCVVWANGIRFAHATHVHLDLHHPNGERIARAFHGRAPTTPIEDLAYLRDDVLATVAMVSE